MAADPRAQRIQMLKQQLLLRLAQRGLSAIGVGLAAGTKTKGAGCLDGCQEKALMALGQKMAGGGT